VIDAGREPRQVLRYHLQTDRSQRLRLTLRQTTSRTVAGSSTPLVEGQAPTTVLFDVTPKAASPEGNPRFTLDVVRGDGDASAAPPLDAMRAGLELDLQSGATHLFLANGYQPPPQSEELLSGLRLALETLFVAFPSDAVGKGARWERAGEGADEGAATSVVDSYELRDLSGESCQVAMSSKRSSGSRPVDDPRAPASLRAGLRIEGAFAQAVLLDRLPPRVKGDWVTTVSMGGAAAPRPLETKVTLAELFESVGR
jgi:hypothetical protein